MWESRGGAAPDNGPLVLRIWEEKHSLSLVSKRECSFLLYVWLETIFADVIAMNVSGLSSPQETNDFC